MDIQTAEYEIAYHGHTGSDFIENFLTEVEENTTFLLQTAKDIATDKDVDTSKELDLCQSIFLDAMSEPFPSLMEKAKQFFSIPQNIVLDCDSLNTDCTDNLDELCKECNDLEKAVLKCKVYKSLLEKEIKMHEQVQQLQAEFEKVLTSENAKILDNLDDEKLLLMHWQEQLGTDKRSCFNLIDDVE